MGQPSTTPPMRRVFDLLWVVGFCAAFASLAPAQTAAPLLLPTAIAFDAQGDLYIADTSHHTIRKLDLAGNLTTIAGDGSQGFSGDNGPATVAQLDSPSGIALDASGNLYLADTHNQRIRKITVATGVITTIAGNGTAAFAGDTGPATQASLDQPSALALDARGNLFFADTGNHRIRKITAATGLITTVAGNGTQGFSGDGGLAAAAAVDTPTGLAIDVAGDLYLADTHNQRVRIVRATTGFIATLAGSGTSAYSGDNGFATAASLASPRGVSVDTAGNITIADSGNQRIRQISPQGTITTIAGNGTQAFSGDGSPAVAATLDTPRGLALSPVNLVTLADTGNQRVRQIEADATIITLAGQGAVAGETLTLTAPASTTYGTGTLTATLASPILPTGSVAFFESTASTPSPLASAPLASGTAMLSTAAMPAGAHSLYATYPGDAAHAPTQSPTTLLAIAPAPVTATVTALSILYGQSIPQLTGTLSGVLPQDAGKVTLTLATSAAALSPAGTYPITAALAGAGAGNYALAPLSATLTVAKAPTTTTLSAAGQSFAASQPVGLTLHVASTTTGTPTGSITLLDGGSAFATVPLSATGDASYTASTLSAGIHTLTATYSGDGNFTASTTVAQTLTINGIAPASSDFTLAVSGPTTQTVTAGTAASFAFAVQTQGAALSSPITLAASSLPPGTTASFSPTYLPPGGAVTTFTLTLQTPKATAFLSRKEALVLAFLLLPWLGFAVRDRRLLAASLCLVVLVGTTGCGARVFAVTSAAALSSSYPIVVSGTATSPTGTTLLHTATVTLIVQ